AYTLYLQAKAMIASETDEAYAAVVTLLKRAVSIDPTFVDAWTELARNYANQAGFGMIPFTEGHALAETAATRALEMSPDSAGANCVLGLIKMERDHNFREAARLMMRGLKQDSASELCLTRMAELLVPLGKSDGAISIAQYLGARDPLSARSYLNLAAS